MKKLTILFLLLFLLPLSSCETTRNIVNQTSVYDVYSNLNLNIETGKIVIQQDKKLDKDKMSVTYKYASHSYSDGDTYTFDSKSGVYNEVTISINNVDTILNGINIKSSAITVYVYNLTLNNLNISSNRLDTIIQNNTIDTLKINQTQTYLNQLLYNNINNIEITGNYCANLTIQKNNFENLNVNIIKSTTHFYNNQFKNAVITQDQGRIDGAFSKDYGYTIECNAKQLDTVNMKATNNKFGDGECLIKFTSTNGAVEIWVG